MPFAAKINTLRWDGSAWIDAGDVVVTKNSIAAATEPEGAADKTAVRLNDGTSLRVNQTLQQILDFLNS